jgi:hypothetical protein
MKKILICKSLVALIAVFILSCKREDTTNPNYEGFNIFKDSVTLKNNVSLDSWNLISFGYDTISKIYSCQEVGISDTNNPITKFNSYAVGYYKVNGIQGKINGVKCNQIELPLHLDGHQSSYYNYWLNPDGIKFKELIFWQTDFGNEIVYDTISMPNDFGNVKFSTDSMDLSKGGTIMWDNPDTGMVAIYIYFSIYNTSTGTIWDYYNGNEIFKIVKDNGSYTIHPQDLTEDKLPIYDIKLIKKFNFILTRLNYHLKPYNSNAKLMLNTAVVHGNLSVKFQ